MLHVVACLIAFLLFYEGGWQEGVFKVMKNDCFLVFLAVWVLFPKFLGRCRSSLNQLHETITLSHIVAFPIVFILFQDRD